MLTIRPSVKIGGEYYEIRPEIAQTASFQTKFVPESPEAGFCNGTAYLTYTGAGKSLPVTELYGLDITVPIAKDDTLTLHTLSGDCNNGDSFRPQTFAIGAGETLTREPTGARPSNTTAFPYFDLSWTGGALVCGIGWSGQWKLTVTRSEDSFRVTAGQADCDMVLESGEQIRSVRILMLSSDTEPVDRLCQRFVKLHRKYYSPAVVHGEQADAPITVQCFDRYFWSAKAEPGKAPYFETEEAQVKICDVVGRCGGFDTHWVDACWFKDTFRSGVGNYSAYSDGFPNGMKAISDAAHRNGMRFIVWFEPVRAMPDTEVWKRFEHDNTKLIRIPNSTSALVNLGDPEVWQWMYDHIVACMEENGIDSYREDFNIDPLDYLRSIEAPDRKGLAQMRFTEGIYKLWDALRAHFPGLLIDNCSSGGRLLDVETCNRAYSLWQSDTGCSPDMVKTIEILADKPTAIWHQNENMALSRYLPHHQTSSFETDAYHMRSASTYGISCEFDFLNDNFDTADAGNAVREVRELARYWYGDFTPLTDNVPDTDVWSAYTLRLPETDEGMVTALRRADAPESFTFALKDLSEDRTYTLILSDEDRTETTEQVSGKTLIEGYTVSAKKAPASVVIRYMPSK